MGNLWIWLVVHLPIWKIWKSIGMMKFPIYGKIKHVPNHQSEDLRDISITQPVPHRWTVILKLNICCSWLWWAVMGSSKVGEMGQSSAPIAVPKIWGWSCYRRTTLRVIQPALITSGYCRTGWWQSQIDGILDDDHLQSMIYLYMAYWMMIIFDLQTIFNYAAR